MFRTEPYGCCECDSAHVEIQECRNGHLIGAWAVGGNVIVCVEVVSSSGGESPGSQPLN